MINLKTVLITGASRGIGLLTAKTLAKAGYRTIAAMRDIQGRNATIAGELDTWAKENGYALEVIALDVIDEASVHTAVQALEERLTIDILINNAGVMPCGITEAYTPEQLASYFDINVIGAARTCRAVLPFMRERKSGLLIHISSNAGRLAMPLFGVYCATKWALEALVESMHYELAPFNIESLIVEPGGHATDLIQQTPSPKDTHCLASYGPLADAPNQVVGMFQQMFAQKNSDTDAQNVADAILTLIEKDSRPIRTTVGNSMGVEKLNQKTQPIQEQFLDAYLPMAKLQRKPTPQSQDERLYIQAIITLKPEFFEAGKAAIEEIIPKTLQEPGCHVFSLMENSQEKGQLNLFEVFTDESALAVHQAMDYTKAIFTNYEPWLAKPIEITKLKSASAYTAQQFA